MAGQGTDLLHSSRSPSDLHPELLSACMQIDMNISDAGDQQSRVHNDEPAGHELQPARLSELYKTMTHRRTDNRFGVVAAGITRLCGCWTAARQSCCSALDSCCAMTSQVALVVPNHLWQTANLESAMLAAVVGAIKTTHWTLQHWKCRTSTARSTRHSLEKPLVSWWLPRETLTCM